jgi:hypothetical protein
MIVLACALIGLAGCAIGAFAPMPWVDGVY